MLVAFVCCGTRTFDYVPAKGSGESCITNYEPNAPIAFSPAGFLFLLGGLGVVSRS
jgi:hypothetical protein